MGMPALIYRWYFRAHGVGGLERSVLKFAGMKPVRETLLGMVDAASDAKRRGLARPDEGLRQAPRLMKTACVGDVHLSGWPSIAAKMAMEI
jgi:hypothetical protein